MHVLWDADGPLTGREVLGRLDRADLAYTTVLTVLTRLQAKTLVSRTKVGRAHAYLPLGSREEHVAELMRAALDVAGDRDAALARFAGTVTEDEADVLRRALREHGRS